MGDENDDGGAEGDGASTDGDGDAQLDLSIRLCGVSIGPRDATERFLRKK